MHSLSRALSAIGLMAALLVLFAAPAMAAETASSDLVIIQEHVVISDDLYASGFRVIIEGKVDGDLIAFAAEDIVIKGEVTGSVFAVAAEVFVSGVVGKSLRASANRLEVTGVVGKDIVAVASSGELADAAVIEGDVLLWAFDAVLGGSIGGDLSGTMGSLELEGSVGGDVEVTVSRLSVTGPLQVSGDLGYRSEDEATGLDQVDLEGVIVHETPLPPNVRVRALVLLARLLTILGLTTAALLVTRGWPRRTETAAEAASARPVRAYGLGLLVMVSPALLVAGAGLIVVVAPTSASLPLLAILAPLVLALTGVVLVLSLVAGVPVILMIGRRLPGDLGIHGSVLAGAAVAGVVWLVPLVGWLVPLTVLPLGMGAWILGMREENSRVARA